MFASVGLGMNTRYKEQWLFLKQVLLYYLQTFGQQLGSPHNNPSTCINIALFIGMRRFTECKHKEPVVRSEALQVAVTSLTLRSFFRPGSNLLKLLQCSLLYQLTCSPINKRILLIHLFVAVINVFIRRYYSKTFSLYGISDQLDEH